MIILLGASRFVCVLLAALNDITLVSVSGIRTDSKAAVCVNLAFLPPYSTQLSGML